MDRPRSNVFNVINDLDNTGATDKRLVSNVAYAIRDSEVIKAGASVERLRAYTHYATRDNDALKVGAVVECARSDDAYARGNNTRRATEHQGIALDIYKAITFSAVSGVSAINGYSRYLGTSKECSSRYSINAAMY